MKSTILQIIVKEWFKDRLGGELEDVVLEAIIKELTEKKDNRITITDIEPRSSRIHYESEKDAEANKESEWISVKDRMPPLHKEGNLPIVEILGEDNVTMEGYYCHIFGLWMTTHDTIVKVTHWKYKNK
jgi:hypothetical protein